MAGLRAVVVAAVVAACSREEPRPPASTIAVGDYIGPAACGECHREQHDAWRDSLHAVMNQRAEAGAVIGDFDTVIAYRGGTVAFAMERGAPTVELARDGERVRYRVTRTIGRRGLQEYVGIAGGDEVRLPFGWWPRGGGWFLQPYYDPWLEEDELDPFVEVTEPWAERCPWCHSTYAFEQRIARASRPRGRGHGLEQQFVAAPGSERLDVAAQVSVGISCESCHLGGRAHADGAPIHFVPIGAAPRPGAPVPAPFAVERRDPAIVGAVCAQCHSGPSPRLPDGTALRNSSESLDLAASPCVAARCTDCHDPHRGGADEARAIRACVGCHAGVAPHAGAGHDGVSCLDCHMPRVVMGIDRYVRTHRISSPTDRRVLASGAPNACNLCHLERSIAWTADKLGVALETSGDSDAAAGAAWLASARPAFRLIAAAAYARSPRRRDALPELLRGLDDELPHVRMWMKFAVEDVLGRRLREAEYDPRAPGELRRRAIARLRR